MLAVLLLALFFGSCKDDVPESNIEKDCKLIEEHISYRSEYDSFDSKIKYLYDVQGKLLKEQYYNKDTLTKEILYQWDPQGRLIGYGGHTTCTYEPSGHRWSRRVDGRDSSVKLVRASMHHEVSDTLWEYEEGEELPHTIIVRFYENGNPVRVLRMYDNDIDGLIDQTEESHEFFDDKRFYYSSIPSTYWSKWHVNNHLYSERSDGTKTEPKQYEYNSEGYPRQRKSHNITFTFKYDCN